MMGSGGMIVMDEDTCMVDVARYFLSFLAVESCGKCTPCREGLARCTTCSTTSPRAGHARDDRAPRGARRHGAATSLCALGTSAVNPVLSTLRYFRDEYEAHVKEKRCPAGVCKALITFSITRALHRLHGVREVPGGRHRGREEQEARDRHEAVHQVRDLQGRLHVRRRAGVLEAEASN